MNEVAETNITANEVAGKTCLVVGLGASGRAAVRALLRRGARVVANDARAVVEPLEDAGHPALSTHLGDHNVPLDGIDLVVVSPGVPKLPVVDAALARKIPVWGEIELGTRLMMHSAPMIAIGGTNGKSTVTSLLGAFFESPEATVFCGGNLGEPLAPHIDDRYATVILEVSSFQMERVDAFHPRAAILLNVTADHLDRYDGMAGYAEAKGNMFLRQTADDLAVIPYADDVCNAQASRGAARIVRFGANAKADLEVTSDAVIDHRDGEVYPREGIRLQGAHNAANVAAAIAVARDMGLSPSHLRAVLATFEGLAHRMAYVATVGGVRFYDDSKGTNVGASCTALRGLAEPRAVLIAGGRDKQGGYVELRDALAERGRAAVVLGEAADAIADAVSAVVPVAKANSMNAAVDEAFAFAKAGDAVLLSPACSSFDMFRDYKHRGDAFVAAVLALRDRIHTEVRS